MKQTLLLSIAFIQLTTAQTATYKDVAVIINTNSAISDSIGTYFAQGRKIPAINIIRISAPITEEIDSLQFESMRAQIENYLTTNHIVDSINYIVTTKGVPLKVKRFYTAGWSSVESELSLILSTNASYIGRSGRFVSPYYRQSEHFTRSRYNMYIVTRLDGYTYNDVKGIIDRAAVINHQVASDAKFVFDIDPLWNPVLLSLNANMSKAKQTLVSRGLTVDMDSTNTYVTGKQNVIGYTSWGSNDKNTSQYGRVYNSWMPGAIAETYVSTSGRTFTSPPAYGQSLIADLILEGITAAKGYVYEPYSSAMADVSVLFDRYSNGYTVAESYYSASPYLSWMDVIIGDPKFRLIDTRLPSDGELDSTQVDAGTLPVELASFNAMVKGNVVELNWSTATEVNNYGFEIERSPSPTPSQREGTSQVPPSGGFRGAWVAIGFIPGAGNSNSIKSYSFVDPSAQGRMVYRLKQIDNDGKFVYSKEIEISVSQVSQNFTLMQNYPNPFNPTTTISYQLPATGHVTLKVYDAIGREAATLVDEMQESGSKQTTFMASNLASGTYFYTLHAGSFTETKRMLLLK